MQLTDILKSAWWFQALLKLKCGFRLVSKCAFKCNLDRYARG
jgi:hypothetical protein